MRPFSAKGPVKLADCVVVDEIILCALSMSRQSAALSIDIANGSLLFRGPR
jgi:hypothetical protein